MFQGRFLLALDGRFLSAYKWIFHCALDGRSPYGEFIGDVKFDLGMVSFKSPVAAYLG